MRLPREKFNFSRGTSEIAIHGLPGLLPEISMRFCVEVPRKKPSFSQDSYELSVFHNVVFVFHKVVFNQLDLSIIINLLSFI